MRCRIEVLSRDEIYDIHVASLEVLEYTGVTFRSKEALKIFDDYGAIVDYEKFNVKIPGYMVEGLYAHLTLKPKKNPLVYMGYHPSQLLPNPAHSGLIISTPQIFRPGF